MSVLLFSKFQGGTAQRSNTLVQKQILQQESGIQFSNTSSCYIGTFDEIPSFMINKYIQSGYRLRHNKPKRIIRSLFQIHNQTLNIWTHLIGFTLLLFLLFQILSSKMENDHVIGNKFVIDVIEFQTEFTEAACSRKAYFSKSKNNNKNDKIKDKSSVLKAPKQRKRAFYFTQQIETFPITINILGSAFCLACSTTFHLLNHFNRNLFKLSQTLDYLGIGINLATSPVPIIYYHFYCQQNLNFIFIFLNILSGCVYTYFTIEKGSFQLKSVLLSFLVQIIFVSYILLEQIVMFSWSNIYSVWPGLYFYLGASACTIIGSIFYVSRFPQRYYPGKFDIYGHSHQIWHLFVVLTAIFVYLSAIASYEIRSIWKSCEFSCQDSH